MSRSFDEIRALYIERYPHLGRLKDHRLFAKAALILAAPQTVTIQEVNTLAEVANPDRRKK